MISWGNYEVVSWNSSRFSTNEGHINAVDGCPNEPHDHMIIQFGPKDPTMGPPMVIAITQDIKTEEWIVHPDVSISMNIDATLHFMAWRLEQLFGIEFRVNTDSIDQTVMETLPDNNRSISEETLTTGMYL